MKKRNWKKYAFEFLSIFIAVISAFTLNNWNENRYANAAESRILEEISNGLKEDINDVDLNIKGHKFGLRASQYLRKIVREEEVPYDSIQAYYFNILRDFISIQNTSGYENLKSRGLELIRNDSLRTDIISLYEYDYKTLKTLEEDYAEMQFHESYFKEINDLIAPKFIFDEKGSIIGIDQPMNLSESDRNRVLSYLWKMDANRNFALSFYKEIGLHIEALRNKIEKQIM